jgi:hypothetical protein
MKQLLVLLSILASAQIVLAQVPIPASELKKISWLEGTWIRTSLKPGRTGAETWKKQATDEWRGLGFTLQGQDTVFVERMKLVIFENTPAFVADVPENKGLVYFKFTATTAHSFTCENPAHDYPKKIVYDRQDNTLTVTISGDGKSNTFLFERKQN